MLPSEVPAEFRGMDVNGAEEPIVHPTLLAASRFPDPYDFDLEDSMDRHPEMQPKRFVRAVDQLAPDRQSNRQKQPMLGNQGSLHQKHHLTMDQQGSCKKDDADKQPDKTSSPDRDSNSSGENLPISPLGKKPKLEAGKIAARERDPSPVPGYAVAVSLPKIVSFEEITLAASGVSNMSLAHEIAMDGDFRFHQPELKVKDVMQRAFWDALQSKLSEPLPDYGNALLLLQEVKETWIEILPPRHHHIRSHLEDVLDLELIEQKAVHVAMDYHYYADFVISSLVRLYSPARDENITQLQQLTQVVPLYIEIVATPDLMQMDMANSHFQICPDLQQQVMEYERSRFRSVLCQDPDGSLGNDLASGQASAPDGVLAQCQGSVVPQYIGNTSQEYTFHILSVPKGGATIHLTVLGDSSGL